MGKRFASVSEMVQATAGKAFADRFDRATANRSVSRALFGLRNAQGLTQEELASKMGITQSAVSRLEHSDNDKIRLDEIAQYSAALGLKVSVNIHPEWNAVEWVKYHVGEARKYLLRLVAMSKGDVAMSTAVVHFCGEYTYNVLKIAHDAISKLDVMPPPEKGETLEVTTPESEASESMPDMPMPDDNKPRPAAAARTRRTAMATAG